MALRLPLDFSIFVLESYSLRRSSSKAYARQLFSAMALKNADSAGISHFKIDFASRAQSFRRDCVAIAQNLIRVIAK
jgi:hypothetical protein